MFLLRKKKEKVNPHFKFVVYCYDDKNKKCYIGEDMEKTSFYDSAKFLTRGGAEDWVELIETGNLQQLTDKELNSLTIEEIHSFIERKAD